jgi:hypothetical protein
LKRCVEQKIANKKPRLVRGFLLATSQADGSKRSTFDDVFGLDHAADVAINFALSIYAGEIRSFQTALAGGKEVLTVDCADPFATVVRAGAGIDSTLTKHIYHSTTSCSVSSLTSKISVMMIGDKWS